MSSYAYSNEYDVTSSSGGYGGGSTNETYTRDAAGRVTNRETNFAYYTSLSSYVAPNLNVNQAYSYLPNGKLAQSPEGQFTYDERGLIKTRVVGTGMTYSYEYDAVGRNTRLTYPDGHERVQGYDAEGRLTSRCNTYGDSTRDRCYYAQYDAAGNPVMLRDPEGADHVEYDALDRVARVIRVASGQGDLVENYSYNALGALVTNANVAINDQRPVLAGNGTGTAASAIPATTLSGAPIAIDPEGKITALGDTALTFSRGGMVTSIGSQSFKYDGAMRVAWTAANTRYTYEGPNRSGVWLLTVSGQEDPGSWHRTDGWLYDGVDHPLEHVDADGSRVFYELDLTGNVRRLRGPQGTDLGGYAYTAFGQLRAADQGTPAPAWTAQPFLWKGRPRVSIAGGIELYDVRARWWAPQLGVFLSIDGFRYHDARTTLWAWPGQNPIRWSDPTGHYAGVPLPPTIPSPLAGFLIANPEVAIAAPLVMAGLIIAHDLYDYLNPAITTGENMCPEGGGGAAGGGGGSGDGKPPIMSGGDEDSGTGPSDGGAPTTRIIAGTNVVSRGQIVASGNVDLGPTIDGIQSGALAPRDTFANREGLLPQQPVGYYNEFTVPTPGISGAGPQRIIQGAAGELFYTPDHYGTFIPLR